jgi:hypothetical protein
MLTCFSKQYLGVECPGCGIQRSAISLFRGDILDSLALYPALIPFGIFCVIGILALFKSARVSAKWVVIMGIVTVIIMLTQYVLKITGNAPWYYEAATHFHL